MNEKEKPYIALDTHAGAGQYALDAEQAKRTSEFADGIGRLWLRADLPEPLATYRKLIRELNPGEKLRRYPGSPWIASHLIRNKDRLKLAELHSTDYALLRRTFRDSPCVSFEQADGFELLKAALPPVSRRGLVLIDPSYEVKSDYMKVTVAIKDALKRFATGTYLVWHPLLPSIDANQLPEKLKKAGAGEWLHATLSVRAPATKGYGMHGSGIFVINPPWTLAATLKETLPYLVKHLALDERATWTLDQSSGVNPAPAKEVRRPVIADFSGRRHHPTQDKSSTRSRK
jgi:23S rRNA (adenine2030-N6)-methyltransferase